MLSRLRIIPASQPHRHMQRPALGAPIPRSPAPPLELDYAKQVVTKAGSVSDVSKAGSVSEVSEVFAGDLDFLHLCK